MDLMSLLIRIGADTASAEKGIKNVQDGMNETAKKGDTFGDKLSKAFGVATKAATGLVAGAAAITAGIVKLASGAASTADHIDKMSQKIGISRTAYQELDFVMSQSGSSVDNLQAGMKTLTAAMDKVKSGNEDATDTFKKLGVEVTNADGTFRSQEDVFFDTVSALQGVSDQTEKSRLATELFGRAGLELMPLLNGAAGSMDEMRQQAHDLGLVMNDESIDAGVKLTDTMDQVKRAFGAIVTQLGVDLMPLVQTALEWVKAHMPEIREFVSNAFTVIKNVISGVVTFITVNLIPTLDNIVTFTRDTIAPAIKNAWDSIKAKISDVITAIVGYWNDTLKPAFEAIRAFIVDTVAPAVQTAWQNVKTKVETVFSAIKGYWDSTLRPAFEALRAFVVETVVPAVQTAWQNVKTKIDTVFTAIKNVWESTLKPAFEAIQKFLVDTLKPIFANTFDAIKTTVDNSLGAIKDLWNNSVKPIYNGILTFFKGVFKGDFETAWNGIQKIVEGVWNAIQTAAETAWKNAKTWGSTIVANFTLAFQNAWNLVKGSVLGLWDGFKAKATEIWEGAKQWGATIIANFTLAFTNAWNLVKNTVTGLWDAIKDKAKELWEGALNWGKSIVDNFKNSISTAWTRAIGEIKLRFQQIPDAIGNIVKSALNWGQDLIDNFKKGIENKWQGLKDKVEGVADSIKNFLGFSVPKEGPLHDFDTYAPDMIELFTSGIKDGINTVISAIADLTTRVVNMFSLMGTGAYQSFNGGLNGRNGTQLQKAIENPIKNAVHYLMQINWKSIGQDMYEGMTYYISWIRDAYRNAFDFSNMYVKTPHFYVSSWTEVSGTYYPNFSVSWYRKAYENAIMFTRPTVLGTAGGLKGFGDGPGGEIVLSDEKLRKIVGDAGGDTYNNTINVYQRDGEDMDAFVRRIEEIMTRHDNQRKAAFA